ncbi:DUF2993 domain-containing protein [Mycobacterium sp. 141]|uniref:LmeA family phospholipid-binding protein n=1 Tax=Mycobacterium sp. 141 TaxID=1120797 RepID=UPI0003628F94|nr:DUF2993 domain-containing protein [Mycobacterium sp. 141]
MTDPWARPTDQSPPVTAGGAEPPQVPPPGYQAPPPDAAPKPGPPTASKIKKLLSDPVSIVLVVVIVLALVAAGLLGGELYARKRADSVVAGVVSCVVQDDAKASFDPLPPFLWQHATGHYTNINIVTAGNQVREAKGMKVVLGIKDVRIQQTDDSSGTVGSLTADITWSLDGLRQTAANMVQLPFLGSAITDVSTNASAGTIQLKSMLGTITAKPVVADKGIALQIIELKAVGLSWPRETIQPILDSFTSQLTDNYPMGIHADSVQVTDNGVNARYSTQNASMPKGSEDPCFAKL